MPQYEDIPDHLGARAHEYDLVVGDDTSGRLPALVAWRYINHLRRWYGLDDANVAFVSPKLMYGDVSAAPYAQQIMDESMEAALVVSERVGFGTSAMRIGSLLSNETIDLMAFQDTNSLDGGLPFRYYFYNEHAYGIGQDVFDLSSSHSGVIREEPVKYAHSSPYLLADRDKVAAMRQNARVIAASLAVGTVSQLQDNSPELFAEGAQKHQFQLAA